jgi:protein tyrosine phosphatase (PTP) superfamily phosphohydrolase (DUF442 family)
MLDESVIAGIKNYRRLSDRIATAGQPSEQELDAVARAGYQCVINLHVPSQPHAPADEGALVRSLGLDYVHIPVPWEHPAREHLERFFEAMDARQDQRLFIHCAANMRVSAFVALYRIHRLGWAEEEALAYVPLASFPRVWREFIDEMLAHRW